MNSIQIAADLILIAAIFAVSAASVGAGNRYVRPNESTYGSADGSSWSNAFSGFSTIARGSIACGDTIRVAGGTCAQDLLPQKSRTSTLPLFISRARGAACISSARCHDPLNGWDHSAGWQRNAANQEICQKMKQPEVSDGNHKNVG